jgi:RNA polymerase sigma-70 factor (ECF subfamily)
MGEPTRSSQPSRGLRLVRADDVDLSDFAAVFSRYSPYVASIGLRILGRDAELDDLVQEVFLEAHKGLSSLREPDAIKGWLGRICVRRATRILKRRRLWAFFGGELPREDAALAEATASPEQAAQVARVYERLRTLGADERVAWVLRFVEGNSLDEVAALCGCSKSTVQRRLREAQRQLGVDLEETHD